MYVYILNWGKKHDSCGNGNGNWGALKNIAVRRMPTTGRVGTKNNDNYESFQGWLPGRT